MATQDLYQAVTDRIVAALEKGVAPWVRPWSASSGEFGGLPFNGYTRRAYRGVNVWLLMIAGEEKGYTDPRWFTLKQANTLGARIRRGEKSTVVIFWKQHTVEDRSDGGDGVEKTIPLLRSYRVFNAAQCEGIAELPKPPEEAEEVRHQKAKELVERSRAEFRHGGDQACYVPGADVVRLPRREAFESEESYWGTALHELTHWTGHGSRLDRDLSGRFGSEAYAAEELVAEMGAAFVCATLGIEGQLRHPEYIGSWLKVLGNDKRAVFTASSLAQRAADLLLTFRAPAASHPDQVGEPDRDSGEELEA